MRESVKKRFDRTRCCLDRGACGVQPTSRLTKVGRLTAGFEQLAKAQETAQTARHAPARRRIRPFSADRAELGRRNGGSKLDAPLRHGHVDHAADDRFVERPGWLDPHGESRRNETPELRHAAAVAGQVD